MARPSSYKPEYCERVFEYALLGCTDDEIAQVLGISRQTLDNWKNKNPELLDTLKNGRIGADGKVAAALYKKALNGDTTAMIFWLKNRRKETWRVKDDEPAAKPEDLVKAISELAESLSN